MAKPKLKRPRQRRLVHAKGQRDITRGGPKTGTTIHRTHPRANRSTQQSLVPFTVFCKRTGREESPPVARGMFDGMHRACKKCKGGCRRQLT